MGIVSSLNAQYGNSWAKRHAEEIYRVLNFAQPGQAQPPMGTPLDFHLDAKQADHLRTLLHALHIGPFSE